MGSSVMWLAVWVAAACAPHELSRVDEIAAEGAVVAEWPSFRPLEGFEPTGLVVYGDGARRVDIEGGVVRQTELYAPDHDVVDMRFPDRFCCPYNYVVMRDDQLGRWETISTFDFDTPAGETLAFGYQGWHGVAAVAEGAAHSMAGVFRDPGSGRHAYVLAAVPHPFDVEPWRDDQASIVGAVDLPEHAGPLVDISYGGLLSFESGLLVAPRWIDERESTYEPWASCGRLVDSRCQLPFAPGERVLACQGSWAGSVLVSQRGSELVLWQVPGRDGAEDGAFAVDQARESVLGPCEDIVDAVIWRGAMACVGDEQLQLVCLVEDPLLCPVAEFVRVIDWRALAGAGASWSVVDVRIDDAVNTGSVGPDRILAVYMLLESATGQAILTVPFTTPEQAKLTSLGDVGARGLLTVY